MTGSTPLGIAGKGSQKCFSAIWMFISSLSIFKKIFYGTISIVLFVIAISSYVSYRFSWNIYENEAMDNAKRMVEIINKNFEDNLDQVERIITLINVDPTSSNYDNSLRKILSTKTYNGISDEYTALQVTKDFFQQLVFLRKDFIGIYMYVSKVKSFSYTIKGVNKLGYDPTGEKWYQDTLAADGKTIILPPHSPYQLMNGVNVVSFARLLKNTDDISGDPYGVVLIDLSMDSINSTISKVNLGDTTGVMFLDTIGNVIFTHNLPNEDKEVDAAILKQVSRSIDGKFTADIAGTRYLAAFSTSTITGWKMLSLTPYSEVAKDGKKLLLFSLILVGVALLITVLLSHAFSKLVASPIQLLHKGISKVKKGDFDFQLQTPLNDELGQLLMSFNSMVSTIKTLILETYEERLARKDAEFKYLQAQINPHFMYNTLQVISSMAVVKKVPEISSASKSLARMLRYSIQTKNKIIPVKEEIDNAVSYLEIQKLRFKDFLNYELKLEEDIFQYGIIKLVLQPIVENAVSHGIEEKGGNGRIIISGKHMDGIIELEVYDNGAGMEEEEVRQLQQEINRPEEDESRVVAADGHNNVGLRNINQRIKLIFGQEYGLEIASAKGDWTRVRIRIPARK